MHALCQFVMFSAEPFQLLFCKGWPESGSGGSRTFLMLSFNHAGDVWWPRQVLSDGDSRDLKLFTCSTSAPMMWTGVCIFFQKSTINSLVLLILSSRLFSLHHSVKLISSWYELSSLCIMWLVMVVSSSKSPFIRLLHWNWQCVQVCFQLMEEESFKPGEI